MLNKLKNKLKNTDDKLGMFVSVLVPVMMVIHIIINN